MEGVEVKGIELRSEKEGYAIVSVAEKSSLTLAGLKEAIAKTPFELGDVEWTVQPGTKPGAGSQ